MQTIKKIDRNFYRALGEQISKRRKQLDLTQKQLSKLTGYSRSLIDHWELGYSKISDIQLEKLCEALQISNNLEIKVRIGFWNDEDD